MIASLATLAPRGSRSEAAAFLSYSQAKSMPARSFVQGSGADPVLIAFTALLAGVHPRNSTRIRSDCGRLFLGMTGLTRQAVSSCVARVYGVASCLMRSLFAGAA